MSSTLTRLIEVPRPLELVRRSSPRPLRRLETAIADAAHAPRGGPEPDFDDQVLGGWRSSCSGARRCVTGDLMASAGA